MAYQLEHGTNATVPPLIAKKPELKQALAQKENAQAALEQARLNLKRTKLFAPYTGIILTKNVAWANMCPQVKNWPGFML